MSDGNKTEKATPRRKQKAREKGQIPRSRELAPALAVLAVTTCVGWNAADWPAQWRGLFAGLLASSVSAAAGRSQMQWGPQLNLMLRSSASLVAAWVAPSAVVGCAVAIAANLVQGGVVVAPEALAAKAERINPFANAQKIFSLHSLRGMLKSVIPTALLAYFLAGLVQSHWQEFLFRARMPARASLAWMLGLIYEVLWKGGLLFAAWSAADYLLERFSYDRQLHMSREELREESKESEGNPATRGRVRRLQRRMRMRRMERSVSEATVLVTNPTEYAVALKYLPEVMAAPVLLAKGRGLLAQKLRREAVWHGVPIVENPPLARALYRSVEVDQAIPAKLYAAVAEILAFLYRREAGNARRPGAAGNSGNGEMR